MKPIFYTYTIVAAIMAMISCGISPSNPVTKSDPADVLSEDVILTGADISTEEQPKSTNEDPTPAIVPKTIFLAKKPPKLSPYAASLFEVEGGIGINSFLINIDAGAQRQVSENIIQANVGPGRHEIFITPIFDNGEVGELLTYEWTVESPINFYEAGSAVKTSVDSFILTPAENSKVGIITTDQPIFLDNFTLTYGLKADAEGAQAGVPVGADGFSFFMSEKKLEEIPAPNMRRSGGFGVEFDTWKNESDPNDNHIGLVSDGENGLIFHQIISENLADINNGALHQVRVQMRNGRFSLFFNHVLLFDGFEFPGYKLGSKGYLYIGAQTGGAVNRHIVEQIKFIFD